MRARKIILGTLAALVLIAIVLALSIRYLVVSEPSWYRRIAVDPASQAQRQRELQNQITQLRNEVGKAHAATTPTWPSFDVEFTEEQINGTFSRWQEFPALARVMKRLSEPHIRFLDDEIEIAGRISAEGPLMSIGLTVIQTPAGPKLELGRPYAGRMPLTRGPLEDLSEEIEPELQRVHLPTEVVESLKGLLLGEEVAPVVVVPSNVVGKQDLLPARVEKLQIKDGVLRATLRPFDPPKKALEGK